MKVLLIEDDPELSEMYRLALSQAEIDVHLEGHAQAGLDALEAHTFDALILDILLPEHNGLSVLHELRTYHDWAKLPVIILSNLRPYETGFKQRDYAQFGIAAYLIKSETKPHQLVAALKRLHPASQRMA